MFISKNIKDEFILLFNLIKNDNFPMSEERVEATIKKLKQDFEKTPYFIEAQQEGDTTTTDKVTLSVVIPTRNEFPNLNHTLYSIWHCWEADGYSPDEIEIIVVANCCTDYKKEDFSADKPAERGTVESFITRGSFHAKKVRVIYDPIAGNHSARNKGADIARGKYLFFSDAHMAYRPGFFRHMLETIDKTGGMFHGTIGWMGAYPFSTSGTGCGYTLKLGEEIKGTWNNYFVSTEDFFYIPALGHCSVGVRRDQFQEFGGYPDVHRSYGGGEFYINMKWWMFGSTVATHPKAVGYHMATGRGYTWNHDDYIHNVFNIGWALGMDDWLERAYINYLRRGRRDTLERMMAEAKDEMAGDREFIAKKRKKTFNEILVERPWQSMNEKLRGKGLHNILIYHDSWLDLLKDAPDFVQDMYRNSPLQKKLEKFINENLSEFVYKRKQEPK